MKVFVVVGFDAFEEMISSVAVFTTDADANEHAKLIEDDTWQNAEIYECEVSGA